MARYCIFDTAAGFCAIAWSELGVVRFQLPLKSGEAARLASVAPSARRDAR